MIVVICGPPGAGKTTVVSRLARRLESGGFDVGVVHSDDYSSRTYERLYAAVATGALETDAVTLVDATFYRREWRRAFRTLADVRFVLVTASLETCLERNRRRPSTETIDEQGVHVIYREFAPLEADLAVDTDDLSIDETLAVVESAIERWRGQSAAHLEG